MLQAHKDNRSHSEWERIASHVPVSDHGTLARRHKMNSGPPFPATPYVYHLEG